ncbi:type I methionyl aminopeptidase [Candidatus Wolfebacteria bacterium]|nr:MAG: type I methionyl aminopeptidase [Candidatus Wolfebacteria bacterium]
MEIIIKTPEQIEILREGGKKLALILSEVAKKVAPGVTTRELDEYAEKLIRESGDEPAFLNYKPEGISYPYPASLCTSVNQDIVHGIPQKDQVLKEGEIISIDCGLKHKGLYTDHAITVPVGKVSKGAQKLMNSTQEALYKGIEAARGGGHVGDIGDAIDRYAKKHKYGNVRILSGHGVGIKIHEDPYIPNYGKKGTGEKLVPGMVIAIEPMFNEGTDDAIVQEDEFTFTTADSRKSSHFEHTILITEGAPEILTQV